MIGWGTGEINLKFLLFLMFEGGTSRAENFKKTKGKYSKHAKLFFLFLTLS